MDGCSDTDEDPNVRPDFKNWDPKKAGRFINEMGKPAVVSCHQCSEINCMKCIVWDPKKPEQGCGRCEFNQQRCTWPTIHRRESPAPSGKKLKGAKSQSSLLESINVRSSPPAEEASVPALSQAKSTATESSMCLGDVTPIKESRKRKVSTGGGAPVGRALKHLHTDKGRRSTLNRATEDEPPSSGRPESNILRGSLSSRTAFLAVNRPQTSHAQSSHSHRANSPSPLPRNTDIPESLARKPSIPESPVNRCPATGSAHPSIPGTHSASPQRSFNTTHSAPNSSLVRVGQLEREKRALHAELERVERLYHEAETALKGTNFLQTAMDEEREEWAAKERQYVQRISNLEEKTRDMRQQLRGLEKSLKQTIERISSPEL